MGRYPINKEFFPYPQEGCYEALKWTFEHADEIGIDRDRSGIFREPEDGKLSMRIPSEFVPKCPVDGGRVVMNLRSDDSFVEDDGWRKASESYSDYLYDHMDKHVLYLELGVGSNTPVIIKYPFWQMTASNPKAVYACINYSEAYSIRQIERQSICIDRDIGEVLNNLRQIQ